MAGKTTKSSKKSTGRKSGSKSKSHYPTVRSVKLGHALATLPTRVLYVDRALSRVNRRLYRQGRYYNVKIDLDNDDPGQYTVFALRDDWAIQKGYQMAYAAYMDNTKEERASLGKKMIARWEDFRVGHPVTSEEIYPTLYNTTFIRTILNAGEFELSSVVKSDGNGKSFTIGPGNSANYGVLEEYDLSSNAQASPESAVADIPYDELNDEIDAGTAVTLTQDNNEPPYDKNGVNATLPFVEIGVLGATVGVQALSTGYFTAPMGLVFIRRTDNPAWTPQNLTLTVKAGDYKGVHAPSMLE